MIHINIEKLTNGIILIGIGILFLLSNFGIIQWSIFNVFLQLWPLILIVIGINLILKKNRIIIVITWLLFFMAIIAYGFMFEGNYEERINTTINSTIFEKKSETTEAQLNLNVAAAKVILDSKTNHLIYASVNPQRIKSDIKYNDNQKTAIIEFNNIKNTAHNIGAASEYYRFSLNDNVTWQISSVMGAVSGDMDFSNVKIKNMDLDVGAGNLKLQFGNDYNATSNIEINAGASHLHIILPKSAGVKLKLEGLVDKKQLESFGWQKDGQYYYSTNYHDADSKLHFDIDMGIGNLDIDLE